jgi:predicted RNA-binding protein with PUA-like domain
MQYWLIKSEPFVYSFEELQREGRSVWDGVRNYQARNNLRAMKLGDQALFYHSNEGLAVVGIAKCIKEFFPDPTATDGGDWSAVEFGPVRALARHVTLKEIKAHPDLQNILLIRNGRLSVMPVEEKDFQLILELGAG